MKAVIAIGTNLNQRDNALSVREYLGGMFGSDKRELYTIAQALQKPYHDLLFTVHRIIMKFNQWKHAYPECPFIQLTTLDENRDAKQVTPDAPPNDD